LRPSSKTADRPLSRVLLGLACTLLALLPAAAPAGAAASPADAGAFARAMTRELNRARAARHLPAVREDRRMDRGAYGHSRDMAQRGYFAHGSWPGRVMAAAGRAQDVGEVIGWRVQGTPAQEAAAMVREWLGSPPHRHVLLHGGFGRIGVGRATGASPDGYPTALYTVDWAG
jgi:uncharacterized protein YkwD